VCKLSYLSALYRLLHVCMYACMHVVCGLHSASQTRHKYCPHQAPHTETSRYTAHTERERERLTCTHKYICTLRHRTHTHTHTHTRTNTITSLSPGGTPAEVPTCQQALVGRQGAHAPTEIVIGTRSGVPWFRGGPAEVYVAAAGVSWGGGSQRVRASCVAQV
jgi:hypothetical protein